MKNDSISITEVEIVNIEKDIINKNETTKIVINNTNDHNGSAFQPIDLVVKDKDKHIDKSEITYEREKVKRKKNRNINTIRKQVVENLTCCNTWRFRGCFIFFLLVCVTVFFGVVLIVNSYNMHGPFALLSRPWVWSFLVITIFYILLTMFFIIRWKPYMIGWIKRNYGSLYKTKKHTIVSNFRLMYGKNIGLNGRYYLWKLSLYEVFENWWQYYNLRSVFLCNLPYELTSIICFILVMESGLRGYSFGFRLWCSRRTSIRVIDRDIQILSDMFVDLFFFNTSMGNDIFVWSKINSKCYFTNCSYAWNFLVWKIKIHVVSSISCKY